MNTTYLHLLVNHVAIIGSLIAIPLLLYGILAKSWHTKIAAYILMVVAAIAGAITFATGKSAEEAVEHLSNFSDAMIHTHEEAAEKAVIVLYALGLLGLVGFFAEA